LKFSPYQRLLRPLLFRFDPEWTHDRAMDGAAFVGHLPGLAAALDRCFRPRNERLSTAVAGLRFDSPIGLAAGYDKSGRAVDAMAALGFGFVEVGSVSAKRSQGNPKPRLWRLPEDEAVCVYYGLPNDGAPVVAERLKKVRTAAPVGVNLVNTNQGAGISLDAEAILADYVESSRQLQPHAAYLMLNLSCPNTCDGKAFFADSSRLRDLLDRLADLPATSPIFLKVTPDCDVQQFEDLLRAIEPYEFVKGVMLNLSSTRREGLKTDPSVWQDWPGAISGAPTRDWMLDRIGNFYSRIDPQRHVLIAAGGVSSGDDAYRLIRSGASLVQLLTALIYRGPLVVQQINRRLAERLEQDGFESVSQAVGAGIPSHG
jgi:dihydroorotate dehydrogenase (fumarate)/dihydroorotate dehydrogenase